MGWGALREWDLISSLPETSLQTEGGGSAGCQHHKAPGTALQPRGGCAPAPARLIPKAGKCLGSGVPQRGQNTVVMAPSCGHWAVPLGKSPAPAWTCGGCVDTAPPERWLPLGSEEVTRSTKGMVAPRSDTAREDQHSHGEELT